MTKAQAAAYLAGMIDGEGHVRVQKNRSVSVSSTDWDLIEAVVMCCELLGLQYRIADIRARPEKNKKAAWELYMNGKDTLQFIQRKVPIQSERKRAALAEAIAAFKQKPRPPREWLEQKYLVEGLSLQQCAEEWGVKNSVSAWCWMEYYGIPRRGTGAAQTKYPRPERKWLQERVEAGLTLQQIGDQVGAPLAAVWRWCQHYQINRPKP